MMFFIVGAAAALVTAGLVPLVRRLSLWRHIVDDPTIDPERRMQTTPIPLLGGLAIWIVVTTGIVVLLFSSRFFPIQYLSSSALWGIILGSAVIMLGGYFDDRYHLSARYSILFPLVAAVLMVFVGIGIHFITNPFGGIWRIEYGKFFLINQTFNLGTSLFTIIWLMGMMYTTKLLDGLDGLVAGLTPIAALVIAVLCLMPPVLQKDTALLSVLVAGAFLGFLVYNWHPASIFLGEGGSVLAGFYLGVLGIVTGGKIATTLLVVGVPVLDVLWVLVRRFLKDRHTIGMADRKHLHFRLLDVGFSVRQAVLFYYSVAGIFGIIALTQRTTGKLIALIALALFMGLLALVVVRASARRT